LTIPLLGTLISATLLGSLIGATVGLIAYGVADWLWGDRIERAVRVAVDGHRPAGHAAVK
jgi:hypothetical protein